MIKITRQACWCAVMVSVVTLHPWAGASAAPDEQPAKAAAGADQAKAKRAKPKSPVQGYYAIVVKQVGLEGEQLARYKQAVAARASAIDAWKAQHGSKLAEYKKAVADAKKSGNANAAKKAAAEGRKLGAELKKLGDEHRAKILAVLTPEQHVKLNGYNLYVGAMIRYKKVGLNDDQTSRIRELCGKAATDAGSDLADKKKAAAVKKSLAVSIEKDVLTAEQRDKLAQPKKSTPKQSKTPAAN